MKTIFTFNLPRSQTLEWCKVLSKKIPLFFLTLHLYTTLLAQPYTVTFTNVMAAPPTNPYIKDYISQGSVSFTINNTDTSSTDVYLFGIIKRISPSPFSITLNRDAQPNDFTLAKGASLFLSGNQVLTAWGGFNNLNNLDLNQTTLNEITDPNNPGVIKLPAGTYTICFLSRLDNGCSPYDCLTSDPNQGCSNTFTIVQCTQPQNGMVLNTIVTPPLNPLIAQSISAGAVKSSLQFNNPPSCSTQVRLYGKIERISPSSFSIALDPNYQQQSPITINPGVTQLTPNQMMGAFDNFNEGNLVVSGINLASIKDANNRIKLPDGDYRICFYAKYISGGDASNPNLGCGSFKICNKAGGAPQFIQPVTNANINSDIAVIQPVSPVVFNWTPPQSTCGLPPSGYTYDLEIWELYPNQTVTDAINNPYVFRKTLLPSTTFLLDNNLYKNVLQEGKRYAIRVRAISINPNSPVEIDNDGYSRIEAFQYGGSLITQNGVPDPHDYFIPFNERKSSLWDDVYRAYQQRRQSDTLVPIKEYIAFVLTQNGIAYSLDAIELFLALNPELAGVKQVKISYAPKLPVFPVVSANDQKNFDKEHEANLEPDRLEENKFLKYLDTLNNYNQKIPEKAVNMINDLVHHLNSIKPEVNSVDRVTVNYINEVLSELLYELRLYSRNPNTSQYNQLQKLVTTLRELTADSLNGTSLYKSPEKIRASLSSYQSGPNEYSSYMFVTDSLQSGNETESLEYMPALLLKQLLPFDVIVWRTGTVAPFKPVLDAPDLKATFRVFYTLSNLYNHKNPEVNAKSSSRLASTIRVSLPSNSIFSFWTLNMVNHKMTTAEDADLRDVYKNSMKKEPRLKKPSIVLKVD